MVLRYTNTRTVDLSHQTLNGETHNIEVAALDLRDARHADPLLYTIGARLIERSIMIHIELDLFNLQGQKCTRVVSEKTLISFSAGRMATLR